MSIFRHGNFSGDVLNPSSLTTRVFHNNLEGKDRHSHPGALFHYGIVTDAVVVQIKTCKDSTICPDYADSMP